MSVDSKSPEPMFLHLVLIIEYIQITWTVIQGKQCEETSSGFPAFDTTCVVQFLLRLRVGFLCMFQTEAGQCLCSGSLWNVTGLGRCWKFCLLWHFLNNAAFTVQPVRDSCNRHQVDRRTCTAGLTHCCFLDSSPAFLCHSRLLLLTPSKVHSVVVACFPSPVPFVSASVSGH